MTKSLTLSDVLGLGFMTFAFYLGAAVAVAQGHLAPMGALPW